MSKTITSAEFVKKWSQIQLKERTTAQSHFNDICALVGHSTPLEADPSGKYFTFEADATKPEGEYGWADAWYANHFVWEYKGPNKSLEKAYQQALLYKDSLGNPPLIIVSDTHDIVIHTNFTNTVKRTEIISLDRIRDGNGVDLLRFAFNDPEKLKPAQTKEQVTRATANDFVEVSDHLRAYKGGAIISPEQLAHFLVRLLFCLFAEDIGLLPNDVFTKLVHAKLNAHQFEQSLRTLFAVMRTGGTFGIDPIRYFDGGLFDDNFVPDNVQGDILGPIRRASEHDWSNIDPAIFGTLFERIIDDSNRTPLGAHYTSKDDILLVIEPVMMQPIRTKWNDIKISVSAYLKAGRQSEAFTDLKAFSHEISLTRVLDPACGSGNFLYLALRQLLDLQKEVITFAARNGLAEIPLTVSPHQIYGIEKNTYAHELAQVTVWIGYLQWRAENGFSQMSDPILKPLHQIENKDAIIDWGTGTEPTWPSADVIVGNPPFLGGKLMRTELGDEYVDALFSLYESRVAREADLVCYWFEKARAQLETGQTKRVGLLATNSIRGGANRKVLERIKQTGNIFWAQSDRDWILDGAAVNVSMVGFDNGSQVLRHLDNFPVGNINADLTGNADLTTAKTLVENIGIAFMGVTPLGPFTITKSQAKVWLLDNTNPNGKSNSEVLRPFVNASDLVTRRPSDTWIIDFGVDMDMHQASQYKLPFEYILKNVKPFRADARAGDRTGVAWWRHQRPRPDMRKALTGLQRYIVTPGVSKYRIFVWLNQAVLADHALFVFARDDDYFFGILHSKLHECWALRQGTSLEDRPRYTPTTTFETFPFPWLPGRECQDNSLVVAIAEVAKQLNDFRNEWLNPPGNLFHGAEKLLAQRTLTNLYNALAVYREEFKGKQRLQSGWSATRFNFVITLEEIETLDYLHTKLDNAVLDAYGWPHDLSNEQILEKLLALNLNRASA